jgi:hypothetical protein
VYTCGDGFGAELQNGAKRLRQDGFRCPLEAALERARWLKSCEESKEHAPAAAAVKGSRQEQLAAEPLKEMVAPAVAPAVTQLFTHAKEASAHTSTHKEKLAHTPREEQPRPRDPYPVRAANAGAWTAPNITNIAHAPVTSSAANTYRDEAQPGRAASAQVIPAKLMLNQERGQRAAEAAQVIDQQGTAPGSSTASTLEARFAAHVMCNYTPRPPNKLSKKRWVSCDDLHRQLKPLTPLEAERWQPVYVKQLVTELFENHPLFAGRPFSEWCKLMKREHRSSQPALAHKTGKLRVLHFCLEHTHRPPAPPPGVAATAVVRSRPRAARLLKEPLPL